MGFPAVDPRCLSVGTSRVSPAWELALGSANSAGRLHGLRRGGQEAREDAPFRVAASHAYRGDRGAGATPFFSTIGIRTTAAIATAARSRSQAYLFRRPHLRGRSPLRRREPQPLLRFERRRAAIAESRPSSRA